MDTILDNFAPDKLFPTANLLDLEDLNEGDFLNNVVRADVIFIIHIINTYLYAQWLTNCNAA